MKYAEKTEMAYLLLPNGQNMSEWAGPQLKQVAERGSMPLLLTEGQKGKGA